MASGGATDAEAIIREIENGRLDAKIVALISDRSDAYALIRAKEHGIPAICIDAGNKPKNGSDAGIRDIIYQLNPDLILLLGWMKIMSPEFVRRYGHMTWNIHPSLLPTFAGKMDRSVHEELLRRGAKLTGCSLIRIDENADTGPIILQRAVEVREDDTVDSLRDRVQKAEQEILLEAIKLFMEYRLEFAINRYGGEYIKILPLPTQPV